MVDQDLVGGLLSSETLPSIASSKLFMTPVPEDLILSSGNGVLLTVSGDTHIALETEWVVYVP